MTKAQLIETLGQLKIGQKIPGTLFKKTYCFSGVQKYPGRGRFAHLKGKDVVVLHSNERKKSKIILFFEPLYILVNSNIEDITFGHLPPEYIEKYRSGDSQGIPNIYEYESHYKSLARYLKNLT